MNDLKRLTWMRSQIIPGLLGMMDRFPSICVGASVVACRGNHLTGAATTLMELQFLLLF
jgi:hypothetical protein